MNDVNNIKNILILNAGSSGIKFAVYEARDKANLKLIWQKTREIADGGGLSEKLWGEVFSEISHFKINAVGHRIVHGGNEFYQPVLLNEEILAKLEKLTPLAPLHQPYNLLPVKLLWQKWPKMPQVACFDTAFHHGQSEVTQAFALPDHLSSLPIKRYGFHGLSYEYLTERLPDYLPENLAAGRVIMAHLGHGASLCAVKNRQSVATTMGFSALDGLPMGTRSGSVDPGVLLYLQEAEHKTAAQISAILYQQSGLLALSCGLSSDVRVLLSSEAPRAKFALEYFMYHTACAMGSLAIALGGVDAIVFTAGIGEHAAAIRAGIIERLAWLGAKCDPVANAENKSCISSMDSHIKVLVVPTDEARMIARHTAAKLLAV